MGTKDYEWNSSTLKYLRVGRVSLECNSKGHSNIKYTVRLPPVDAEKISCMKKFAEDMLSVEIPGAKVDVEERTNYTYPHVNFTVSLNCNNIYTETESMKRMESVGMAIEDKYLPDSGAPVDNEQGKAKQ
ncbi:MAG: hypothetical protein ACREBH_03700 [Candidatus Micrarchaeaceae archaeon]